MFFITLVLGFRGKTNDKKAFLLIILSIPISILLIKIIHLIYFEPRPFITYNFIPLVKEANDASFPSRHATIVSIIAFSFSFFKSRWALLFLPIMIWVGLSRIYVGVHYPWDIIGGFATGIISLVITVYVKKLIISRIYPHP
ncbi:MAG: phosphatase PAP2 family protein [Candidatus Daviesbacteria bacterium]|nr:phosphatase PAP2 family protein [Candidatus Daviesbacteria bacterium]